ncbi:DMT family transporter [Siculibacillus lacustris]|uniref:DMT family transporter n=1 Tax=Siculibacillus lacustris TaxID=1549641 RepID=UPI001D17F7E0|nr:DMT family transporter [Siculibacillus lacustris]
MTVVALVAFAGNSLLARTALRDTPIDAMTFTSIRLVSGALILAAIAARMRRSPLAEGNWPSALALFAYAVFFSFAYTAMAAGTGALILFAAVQATMIGWGLSQGERFRPIQSAGLVLAAGGLITLMAPGITAPALIPSLAMSAAGIAWGVYSLRGRRAGHPIVATAGNFLRTVPLSLVGSAVLIAHARPDPAGVGWAIASGAVASGLGYAIWYAALPGLTATFAATVQLGVPVIAALGAVLLLGESLSLRLAVAASAVLGGIAIVILSRRRPPPLTPPRDPR